jgi:hypothetical protein
LQPEPIPGTLARDGCGADVTDGGGVVQKVHEDAHKAVLQPPVLAFSSQNLQLLQCLGRRTVPHASPPEAKGQMKQRGTRPIGALREGR